MEGALKLWLNTGKHFNRLVLEYIVSYMFNDG